MTAPDPFDAQSKMRKIRTRQGMMDYLDVKWRVAWLRHDFPAAQIVTDLIGSGIDWSRFKCTITLPNGAIATGHGSETQQDFGDWFEKSETKAIGRACATLGYGTDAAVDFDDGEALDGAGAAKAERAARGPVEPQKSPRAGGGWEADLAQQAHRTGTLVTAEMGFDAMVAAILARGGPRVERAKTSAESRDAVLAALRGMPDAAGAPVSGETPAEGETPPSSPDEAAAAPTGGEGASNIHQVAQLRSLMDAGFDIKDKLKALGCDLVEDLTREQAKDLIIEGRAAVRKNPHAG